ncbi:hypothetical protein BGW36DRAFT_375313 [Talaromyces proteolyticus]|uniref:Uncharacterized protein n=1 Tax=Talaromyces proteolyticus TaxID=1131652 RepID=A0AAD4KU72_9EURO|nr:uncharacterized protein BGW36DRAFT_375313 [Talaromyces proteolyticus]KAH8700963.1 hypothetical protein BGW36DRAFT_375313 [Talaromyces proteolyticus]
MADDNVWLITGCSSGFGLHLARLVLSHGHRVIASSGSPSRTPDVVQEIEGKGGHWINLDATSPDIKHTVTKATEIYGRLDFVVNNVGFSIIDGFEDFA